MSLCAFEMRLETVLSSFADLEQQLVISEPNFFIFSEYYADIMTYFAEGGGVVGSSAASILYLENVLLVSSNAI